jgi:hypothetical protein
VLLQQRKKPLDAHDAVPGFGMCQIKQGRSSENPKNRFGLPSEGPFQVVKSSDFKRFG